MLLLLPLCCSLLPVDTFICTMAYISIAQFSVGSSTHINNTWNDAVSIARATHCSKRLCDTKSHCMLCRVMSWKYLVYSSFALYKLVCFVRAVAEAVAPNCRLFAVLLLTDATYAACMCIWVCTFSFDSIFDSIIIAFRWWDCYDSASERVQVQVFIPETDYRWMIWYCVLLNDGLKSKLVAIYLYTKYLLKLTPLMWNTGYIEQM